METYLVPMWVVECGVQRDGCISMVKAADAQATVEALRAIIKQMGEQACVLAKDGMAAKAQVEALQRELAYANECRTADASMTDQLKMELDAEREKVANTEKAYQEKARLWIEQTGALSQLQALVRAAVERWRAQTNVKEGISFRMAMKALEAALTPAGGGSNGNTKED